MKKCKTCYGYGLHYMGDSTPMGRMDASDGMPTCQCPECGCSANPVKIKKVKDKIGDSFIKFMESFGIKFIDVTPKKKK